MADIRALMSGVMHMMRLIWSLFGCVIKYLHWDTKWLRDYIIGKDFLEF